MKIITVKHLLFLLITGITITGIITSCEKENKTIDIEDVSKNSLVARGANNPQSFIQSPHNLEVNQELVQDDCMEKANLNKNDMEEKKYDKNLDMLAVALVKLTNNPEFVQMVRDEVEKQFDGDYNVLLRDMHVKSDEKGIDMVSSMKTSIIMYGDSEMKKELAQLNGIVNSFNYYENKIYPQVYIPFYDKVDHSIKPIVVVNKNDDLTLPGYELKINSTGIEEFKHITVNKAQAQIQPIWVISINERVGCDGNVKNIIFTNPGMSAKSDCEKWLELYPNIKIIDKKEGWGNGRADIAISWVMYPDYGTISCDNTQWYSSWDYDDNEILYRSVTETNYHNVMKVSNNDLDVWQDIHYEFNLCWPQTKNRIFFIMYEADRRNKFTRALYPETDAKCKLDFRSKETPYWTGHFSWYDYVAIGQWDGTTTNHTVAGVVDFYIRGREW